MNLFCIFLFASCNTTSDCSQVKVINFLNGWTTSVCEDAYVVPSNTSPQIVSYRGAGLISCDFKDSITIQTINKKVKFTSTEGGMGTIAWKAIGSITSSSKTVDYNCVVETRDTNLYHFSPEIRAAEQIARSWILSTRYKPE